MSNYLTRKGFEKMTKEMEELKTKGRREMAKRISEARAHGDLSENSEYDAAKEAQAFLERRIHELHEKLARVTIIDDENLPDDIVCIGITVFLKDMDTGEELEYTLVGEDESDINENKISTTSPIGQGLLRHKKGDVIEIKVLAGTLKYKVMGLSRK